MKKYATQICTVSDQVDANLLPILKKEIRPDNVVLLVTDQMQATADRLQNSIQDLVKVSRYRVKDINNIRQIQELLLQVNISLEDESDVMVNITGGNKPSCIACYQYCVDQQIPYFYIDKNGHYQSGVGKDIEEGELSFRLTEKEFNRYVQAHGYKILDTETTLSPRVADHKDEFFSFVLNGQLKSQSVAQLNWCAAEAYPSLNVKVSERSEEFDALLDQLERFGWVTYKGSTLHFVNEACRDFLNGKWLEVYLQEVLQEALGGVKIYRGLTFGTNQSNKHFKNEFDLVFWYNNKVHVFEVKTSKLNAADNAKQNVIHKLTQLTENFGGLTAHPALISYQPLCPELAARAQDSQVGVFAGHCLMNRQQLIGKLKQWINQDV